MSAFIRQHIQALAGYIPGEQPTDPEVIKLNTNENPYPPPPGVMDALQSLSADDLRRYPDPVCMELRTLLAERYRCTPDQIIVGNGSDELLALTMRAFVENDGAVGYFDPSYSLYPVLADIQHVEKRPVPLGEGFEWADPPKDLAALFLLTHPNAPTGRAYPRERIEAFCRTYQGVVVIDEAYADFADDDYLSTALASDRVLACRTLSKSFSLAGIRCGWAVGPKPLIDALYKIKDSYNVNVLTQRAAGAALRDEHAITENVRKVISTRERTAEALRERGFDVLPSAANFLFARPPDAPAADWFQRLRKQHILVRHFPGPQTGDYLRITIGTDEQMDRFLSACGP